MSKRLSDLTAAAALDGTELVELTQAGVSVRATTQAIADLGAGGGGGASAATPLRKTTVASGAGATLEYKSEPNLAVMADGNILCVYRRGSAHINNDGKIVGKISTDNGATWGTEFDIIDDGSGFDTRNPTLGVDPTSGRVIVFFRVYDAATSTHNDTGYVTSTDNGVTWSAKTSVASSLTAGRVPYGAVVSSSLGLLMTFYDDNKCSLLVSTDGAATWGGEIVVYNLTQTAHFNEPMTVAVDASRVVILLRDDATKNAIRFYKSSDGGATWTYTAGGAYTAATMTGSAPFWAVMLSVAEVALIWGARSTENKIFYVRMTADAFFEDPTMPFLTAFAPMEPRRRIATALKRYGTTTTATDAEFGYPTAVLPVGAERPLVAWYDSGDGTNVNCSIYVMTAPG